MTGNLEISGEVLDYLNRCLDEGKPLKMELAAWNKTSQKTNSTFMSITASVPWVERQGATPAARPAMNKLPTQMRNPSAYHDDDEIPF